MKTKQEIQPEWITEEAACQWLGCDRTTLYKMRKSGLQFTYLGTNRGLMYDKSQINELLYKSSTYAVLNK